VILSSLEGEEEVFVGGLVMVGTAIIAQRAPSCNPPCRFGSYPRSLDLPALPWPHPQLCEFLHGD